MLRIQENIIKTGGIMNQMMNEKMNRTEQNIYFDLSIYSLSSIMKI
jgi:hypothetical protein